MPPVPPARRPPAPPSASLPSIQPLPVRHLRFLRLLAHPDNAQPLSLSPAAFAALPARCQQALARVSTDSTLDPWTRRALEAYYGSGHLPLQPTPPSSTPGVATWDYTEDARRATRLMNVPDGQIITFLSLNPATSDKSVEHRLVEILDKPELKAGDRIRLEALRLLLQLKGHLRDEKAQQSAHATQIVIHTAQDPVVQSAEQPNVIEIEL